VAFEAGTEFATEVYGKYISYDEYYADFLHPNKITDTERQGGIQCQYR